MERKNLFTIDEFVKRNGWVVWEKSLEKVLELFGANQYTVRFSRYLGLVSSKQDSRVFLLLLSIGDIVACCSLTS